VVLPVARPTRVQATYWFIAGVAALAVTALTVWLYLFGISISWLALGASGVLAAVCVTSLRLPVELRVGKATFDLPDVAILLALALGGPLCALLVAVPAMLQREWLRTVFDAATLVLQILAAGYVFQLFSPPLLATPAFDGAVVWGVLAAGCVLCLLDTLIGPALLWIKYETPPSHLLREVILPPLPSDAIGVLTAVATSFVTVVFNPVAALTLFGGGALSLITMNLVREHREKRRLLEAENAWLRDGLRTSNLEFATRLVQSIELKDGCTARRVAASALYAADIARELGMEPVKVEKLRVAALLQDVGLVSVADEVLLTPPKKLNSVGRMHLERHPIQGEHMLAALPGFEEAAQWVRYHHEREDGTGYPDRLRGKWIPLEAKLLAVSEVYASLVIDGPHSPAVSAHEARLELVGLAGGKLDQQVVRTFLRVLDTQDESYAAAVDDRFTFAAGSATSTLDSPAQGAARFGTTGTAAR
jgi:HD-GYP domain-containing protein (c-di-GMP phosphodiesterase class II)